MKFSPILVLGVMLFVALSGILVHAEDDKPDPLYVFNDGCYYPGTCVRTWGLRPDLEIECKKLYLSTDERCRNASVGFGIFSNCPVDVSRYNQLQFGAQLLVDDGIDRCAVKVKIEIEDNCGKKACAYLWITRDHTDFALVLKKFSCVDLSKVTGLFLLTAFDVISYDESKELTLVIDYIRYTYECCYTVWDECTDYQFNGKYNGPISIFYWPDCLRQAVVLTNCPGYKKVLVIPCNVWGAGFFGYSQDLSCFKYLSFYLYSEVDVKVEVRDDCGHEDSYCVKSTCGKWECIKIALCEFNEVDFSKISWQFKITKIGYNDKEVKIANIRYLYDGDECCH